MIQSSYIHIPFCQKKCKYCAFTSIANFDLIENYLKTLLFEIDEKYDNAPQKTIYIGGGTPSLLTFRQIESIVKKFKLLDSAEVTMELNPENVTYSYLSGLFDVGVNRLSIGAQTFDDKILSEIGRRHGAYDTIKVVKDAKKAGFKNISLDLMYGLPYQTFDTLENDLDIIKSLDIEHVSTYGLKIEDRTYYKKYPPKSLPDDDIQALMYEKILDSLSSFYHYEISNFAKDKNYVSKHNLAYWNVLPYNAFGASASGFTANVRYKNTSQIKKYIENPFLLDENIEISKDALLEEVIFLGFRKMDGICVCEINKRFGIDFCQKYKNILQKYTQTGHIKETKDGFCLTKDGILISNYILCDFLC